MSRRFPTANIITCIRIFCALFLIFCPTFSICFYVVYVIAGISDILDGIAARHFGKATRLGAQLDTVADIVFFAVVIIKTVRAVSVPVWLCIWTICIAAVKCFGILMGFVIYKRFVSEHTVLNKICGVLLFSVPFYIGRLSCRPVVIIMILNCCAATAAAVWEGYCIFKGKTIG